MGAASNLPAAGKSPFVDLLKYQVVDNKLIQGALGLS
jgi:hypothetical protein